MEPAEIALSISLLQQDPPHALRYIFSTMSARPTLYGFPTAFPLFACANQELEQADQKKNVYRAPKALFQPLQHLHRALHALRGQPHYFQELHL